jgi:predicted lysophospholipase L1 biosynthesis ABC-type transport system permease subunit
MARLVWPGEQDPIGRSFILGGVVAAQVIGVAGDVNARDIRSGVLPQAYFPFTGSLAGPQSGPGNLTVKASGDPMALLRSIRAEVGALDPTLALVNPRTMDDVIADGMADTTLQAWLLGAFAALAAALAAVGLYSVMAFLVAERRHEMGVRIALGAGDRDLLRLVLWHATKLIAIGVVAGVAAALWLTRLIQGLLFGVVANDLPTFAAVSSLLVLVALAACAVPAWRATHVDPIRALRYE